MSEEENLWGKLESPVLSARDIVAVRTFCERLKFPIRPEFDALMKEFEAYFEIPEDQRPEFPLEKQEIFRDEMAYCLAVPDHPLWQADNVKPIFERFHKHGNNYVLGQQLEKMLTDEKAST